MDGTGTDGQRRPCDATRRAWLGLGALALLLAGCGRKGPLELPPAEDGAPPEGARPTPPPSDVLDDDADETL
jgi:predicted small lipoprotein YifL